MEDTKKKTVIKRKFAQLPVTGVVLPFNGGGKPNMAKNPIVMRKTLNPQAYEASAVKQMQSYKQTKSMELFKERGMKFTCVDSSQQHQEENRSGRVGTSGTLSSIPTVSACHVDMMDPSDREAIQFYEGERNGSRETKEVQAKPGGGGFGDSSLEQARRFGLLPLKFDPSVPPPPICQQPPKQKMAEQPPEKKRQIKQDTDVVVEISDDIPSFQCTNSIPTDTNAAFQTSNSDAQYVEIEEKKKRLHLLWSICQEELTVDAELEKTGKELAEMRNEFDALEKAIKIKEKTEGMQKMRKKRIDKRKKLLLTGVGNSEEELKKVKQETGEANE